MLELFTKKPVFQGVDEINQLDVIFRLLGTPTTERWPGVADLPWYELVKPKEVIPNHFRSLFQKSVHAVMACSRLQGGFADDRCVRACRWLSPAALDLAELLLAFDPARRVSAAQALEAPYFHDEQPPPDLPIRCVHLPRDMFISS